MKIKGQNESKLALTLCSATTGILTQCRFEIHCCVQSSSPRLHVVVYLFPFELDINNHNARTQAYLQPSAQTQTLRATSRYTGLGQSHCPLRRPT